jgi:hypothetical protein
VIYKLESTKLTSMKYNALGIYPVLATVAVGKNEIGVLEGARLVNIGD